MFGENGTYRCLRILIALLALGWMPDSMAQELPPFAQHQFTQLVYNPAFAGDREIPGLSFLTRQQWLSWEGSPTSTALQLHTKLKNKNAGFGISLTYAGMGPMHHGGITGAYSYSLQLNENNRLILGLQGKLSIRQIGLGSLELIDQGDQLFASDPGILLQPNAGLGFNYVGGKSSIYMSVPRLLNSDLSPYEGESSEWSTGNRVFYLGTNRRFELNQDFELVPSMLLALSRGSSPFIELAGYVNFRKQFGWGLSYRFDKTLGAFVRYNQQKFVFGYAYDVSFNLIHYNAGSHELFIGYKFSFNKTKTVSPRLF